MVATPIARAYFNCAICGLLCSYKGRARNSKYCDGHKTGYMRCQYVGCDRIEQGRRKFCAEHSVKKPAKAKPSSKERRCKQCGIAYTPPPDKRAMVYCSHKCRTEYETQRHALAYQMRKNSGTKAKCDICGNEFTQVAARKYTCSPRCAEARRIRTIQEARSKKADEKRLSAPPSTYTVPSLASGSSTTGKAATLTCIICGSPVPHRWNGSITRLCSDRCREEFKKDSATGFAVISGKSFYAFDTTHINVILSAVNGGAWKGEPPLTQTVADALRNRAVGFDPSYSGLQVVKASGEIIKQWRAFFNYEREAAPKWQIVGEGAEALVTTAR